MIVLPRLACCLSLCLLPAVVGCGDPPSQLTPQQIEKQHAENKSEMNEEDKAEAEFQKKNRKR